MEARKEFKIEAIYRNSPLLASVKALWRSNAKTLGFFPEGAFNQYAEQHTILVATSPNDQCAGYLLYRVSMNHVVIVHLCIGSDYRRLGIAGILVNDLIEKTRHLLGIKLSCRRDFPATALWPRLGFHARSEKVGRSKDGKELTTWWLSYGHPDLFTTALDQSESRLRVVIDANVFFDLGEITDEPDAKTVESKSLVADWLETYLDIWITDEIFNEINRNNNKTEREHRRSFAHEFSQVSYKKENSDQIYDNLRPLFKTNLSEEDDSDLRQLSKTIASGTRFFVTRDSELLRMAEKIGQTFEVTLVRPADLIVQLDELRRGVEYEPARLAGTQLSTRLVQSSQEQLLTDHFQNSHHQETRAQFQSKLRRFMSQPDRYQSFVIWDSQNNPLGLMVHDMIKEYQLDIPLLRFGRSKHAMTLARHLVRRSILKASQQEKSFTVFSDLVPESVITTTLGELGFVLTKNGWLKVNLPVAATVSQIGSQLLNLGKQHNYEYCSELGRVLARENVAADVQLMAEYEHRLWPTKFVDAAIPTFIVPIQPQWAQHLFDENLANQNLFGAREDLALNHEAIYYRSSRRSGLVAPGRILWYVSLGTGKYQGVGGIRACSRLDEVIIGKPKELFSRFRRLGIYEWQDVYKTAKKNVDCDIMALRFSDTALLPQSIPLHQIQQVLNQKVTMISPVRIPVEAFAKLCGTSFHEKVTTNVA
jgi:ribosomal protein S18 acetylase RimI-like enzyme/predicted nucleic acid-binding protein